jgi:hypothetical protein
MTSSIVAGDKRLQREAAAAAAALPQQQQQNNTVTGEIVKNPWMEPGSSGDSDSGRMLALIVHLPSTHGQPKRKSLIVGDLVTLQGESLWQTDVSSDVATTSTAGKLHHL